MKQPQRFFCLLRYLPAAIAMAILLVWQVVESRAQNESDAPKLGLWNATTSAQWWMDHEKPDDWIAGAAVLKQSLLDAQEEFGIDRSLKNKHFMAWMMHCRWISLLPKNHAEHDYFGDVKNWTQFGALGAKPEVVELVAGTLLADDDGTRVAETLCRIAQARPADFDEYLNLAIAFAVVGDVALPEGWPHPYVQRDLIPVGDSDLARRFAFYVEAHKAGELLLDPRKLSVRELCFVVDTVVELRELQYAQQIVIANPRKLEGLYFAVKYDEGRIQRQRYQWQGGSYRLIDVGKRGGICADQAYFVSHAGKAKGVPTVVFMGQGLSGTHAWVGFLQRPGVWEFKAAHIRGEKYPVGVAYDPQTWKRVTDAQMAGANKDAASGRALETSRRMLQWAMLNPEAKFYRDVVATARRTMPRSVEAWELEAAWLAEYETDMKVHQKFWQDWIRSFTQEHDLKIRGQKNLLRTLEKIGDTRAAEQLRERVIAENRSARFDLGISLAADAVMEKITAGEWKEAKKEYEDVMRRFKRKAGGHLFYNLVQPYVNACLQESQFEQAESAVKNLIKDFDAQKGSILDNDMRKLISAVNGAR